MFRVNQSLVSSQMLNGLLSRFNSPEVALPVKTKHTHSNLERKDVLSSPFKRRRRSRRVPALASTGIGAATGASMRSTWF